jgi:hypothetical protein
VAIQLRAVEIQRSIATLTRDDLSLEIGDPTRRSLGKGEPRRDRQLAEPGDALEQLALPVGLPDRCGL